MPSWLVTLLVVLVVGGIVAGAVWLKQRSSATPAELADSAAGTVTPAAAGGHRLAKYVEVAGFRLAEDAKGRANVKMIIVNHSAADLTGLTMTVTLKTPEGKVVGTADVKVPEVGPLASADVTAPFKTTERAYELPDWQFLRADFRITSP